MGKLGSMGQDHHMEEVEETWKKIKSSKRQGVQEDHSTAGAEKEPEAAPSTKSSMSLKGFSPPQSVHN